MKARIVFLDEYTVNNSDLTAIESLGEYTGYDATDTSQIIGRCESADIVITNKTPFDRETLAALPSLKLICIAATGMNNIDLQAAEEFGITVKNAVDYSTHSVAEQTFCGVLALYKQILYYDNFVKSGRYTDSDRLFNFGRTTRELYGKKWGIVGLGNIGRRVAAIAQVFGCCVSYYSTTGNNSSNEFKRVSLEELARESDIISIHAPLSRNTYHLIDGNILGSMKKDAVLVNMARGSLVDERALAEALNSGKLAGAAIDVYSAEPMKADNPLNTVLDKYKLVLTPHSAWSTKEALQNVVNKTAENIKNFLDLGK